MSDPRSNPAEPTSTAGVQRRKARELTRKSRSSPFRAWLGKGALRTAAKLGYPALYRIGGAVGASLARVPTNELRATRLNLELCLPELGPRERSALTRASLAETGRTFLEFSAMWCWPGERVLALVRETVGLELFERARAGGRPVLLLTPHLGAWEMAGLYFSSIAPLTAMYRPPPVSEMEPFYNAARGRLGAKLAPADASGVASVTRALRNGEVVGILPDQDPGQGAGVFVPYFGVLANTTTLVAKLAARSGATVLLTWAERLDAARGFRIHVVEPKRRIGADDPIAGTIALNEELEDLIRTAPQQYLWSYKRFRTRPKGLKSPYRHGIHANTVGERTK